MARDLDSPAAEPTVGRDLAPTEAEEPPGLLKRGAKAAGGMLKSAAVGAQSVLSLFDPVEALGRTGLRSVAGGHLGIPEPMGNAAATWGQEMRNIRAGREQAFKDNPGSYVAGGIAPALIAPETAGGALPFSRLAPAARGAGNALLRAGSAAADSSILNGLSAFGSHADEHPLQAAAAASTSPANLLAGAVPAAIEAAPVAKNLLRALPKVTPTPEAAALLSKGVPLTTGQMAPESMLGRLEEASSKSALTGMEPQRRAAEGEWRNQTINQAAAPGAMPPSTGSTQERLADIYKGFEPAYDKIKGEPVYPAIHGAGTPLQSSSTTPGAFDLAVNDPKVTATPDTRAAAKTFLDDQLGILPGGAQRPNMVQPVDASDLLTIRSNIRKEIRSSKAGGEDKLARLLGNAEQAITDTIGSQLSPESAQHLADTDRQYAKYMTMEDAAGRAGPESEFTPKQLAAAVKKSAGKRATVQGNAGELQDAAQQADAVFGQRIPQNGMRGVVADVVPTRIAGPISRVANFPSVQAAMLRRPIPGAQAMPRDPTGLPLLISNALRRQGGSGLQLLTPQAAADQKDRQ